MTLVLDSGGVSALAGQRARLAELRSRGQWPPRFPAVVLVEVLTGDHRRDFHVNQLIRWCRVDDVTPELSRLAARLRTLTGRAAEISAVDAIVAALAQEVATRQAVQPVVLTSDPTDLHDLIAVADQPVSVVAV